VKKLVPLPEVPTGIRQACAILLASTLATGAFAAPAPQADPVVKKAAAGESPRLSIAHDPLKCLSTEARPLVDARVLPVAEMDQGFVYFRAAGTEDFYYVLMKPRAQEDFMGELPRPMPGIRGIDYYVQALDRESLTLITKDLSPEKKARADESVLRSPGQGAAVMAGLQAAAKAGFTHALQIDADGQHDCSDVPRFVAAAMAEPRALICGRPLFDASIPRHRLYLRYLTHVMVWLNTLSFDIPDSMCGLRVYPLSIVLPAIVADPPGRRMDFDVEVLVRLHWAGVRMRWIPTRVRYALDGVSHFRLVRDNGLITVMHTKLFFGMLRRAPLLIVRRLRAARSTTSRVAT